MGKLMGDRGCFSKVCLCRLKSVPSPGIRVTSGDCLLLILVGERGTTLQMEIYVTFKQGNLCPAFCQKGGVQSVPPVFDVY